MCTLLRDSRIDFAVLCFVYACVWVLNMAHTARFYPNMKKDYFFIIKEKHSYFDLIKAFILVTQALSPTNTSMPYGTMSMFVHDTNNTHIIDYHMYIVFGNFIFPSKCLFFSLSFFLSFSFAHFVLVPLLSGCFAHFLLLRCFSLLFASISA